MAPPRLRVLAGTSPDTMVPITHIVNTGTAHRVSSSLWEGEIAAYIKGFSPDERSAVGQSQVAESEYFKREDRAGVTWSIQVKGRFLAPHSADDILFGNTFDRPLKLPWGTGAVLKFMNYIDPTLEHDLTSSTKPWALSPLIATMPHFAHAHLRAPPSPFQRYSTPDSKFPPSHSIKDSTSQLYLALIDPDDHNDVTPSSGSSSSASSYESNSSVHFGGRASRASSASSGSQSSFVSLRSTSSSKHLHGGSERIKQAVRKVRRRRTLTNGDGGVHGMNERAKELGKIESAAQRRAYFASQKRRKEIMFGPEDIITTDFCYGFINFVPSLSLQLPGGLSFDLMRYWDGQPVRFVCCERASSTVTSNSNPADESKDPWGRIFWCVAIEVVGDDGYDEDEGF